MIAPNKPKFSGSESGPGLLQPGSRAFLNFGDWGHSPHIIDMVISWLNFKRSGPPEGDPSSGRRTVIFPF